MVFFGKIKNMEEGIKSFELTYSKGRLIKISDLIKIVEKLKQTDAIYLCNLLNIGKTTLTKYLRVLRECNIIKNKTSNLNIKNISDRAHLTLDNPFRECLFNSINRFFGHDAKVCRFLGINDFVYCRWRSGDRGIPKNKLIILLKLGKYYKKTNLNIRRTDRKIIEFNNNLTEWRVPWRPWINNIELDDLNYGVKKWITKN